MTKRLLLISALVLLGAIGVATKFRPLSARAAGSVTVLQPIRSFQVQGTDGLRLNDIAVYKGDLFLLLFDRSGSNEILHITGSGDTLQKIPLPIPSTIPAKTQQFKQLRISQSGTLAVSFTHYGGPGWITTVLLYDTQGALKSSFDAPLFNEIAFIGNDLFGIGETGLTQLTSQWQFVSHAGSVPLVLLDSPISILMTASLPQNRLAIVEPLSGRLQIAAMDSLLVAPMVLYAPEIQGVERQKSGDGVPLVVHTIAASPAGNLYIGVTGAKRQEGAPVLQLDNSGILKNRIKCILPTFGRDTSDHESFMYPGKLLATNDSLFWISMSEKKVAIYFIGDLY
jgi:hypothetical protein